MDLTPLWYGVYKASKYVLYPLSWIVVTGLFTLLFACLPITPRRTTWVRRCAFSTLLLLLLTSTPMLATTYIGVLESGHPPFKPVAGSNFDAIVVLAGGIYHKGSLRPSDEAKDASRQRTACGAQLWHQGLAPTLLLTGGDATISRTGPSEASEMKRWALRLGIPESVLVLEEKSRTTYENALETKALLGPARILLVTAAYHIPRAAGLFEKQGLVVTPVACGFQAQHRPREAWARATFYDFIPTVNALLLTTQAVDEVIGILVYWIAGKW